MTDHDLAALARASIEAYNASNWPYLTTAAAEGYVYEETGTNRRIEGAAATVELFQEWKKALPDGRGEIVRIAIDGETTVLDLVWRGTQTGPLATPAGILPASGRSFEMRAVLWQEWRDGKVVHDVHHLDTLTLLVQLGALPAPAE